MMNESDKKNAVDRILDRGVIVQVLPSMEEFRTRLLMGPPMRFYIGADPTSTALHLSHAKNYMLLEEFRRLGHEVVVLFGDFTARIGDPTDQSATRHQLSADDVRTNVEKWIAQIAPLMAFGATENPPRIVYNNDWLAKLSFEDVVALASNITVQRMLERDMFEKRVKEQRPIFLHEFMYPLMQGYDSVALEVDVELCGTDQIFNALVGRTLLKKYKNKDKFVVAVNLMENPRTGELMSKSRGTGVFLDSSPEDMYGAIMSQPDEMIRVFLVNNTRVPLDQVNEILSVDNPRDAKMRAAFEVTKVFHGEDHARSAQEGFVQQFQKREVPNEMPVVRMHATQSKAFDIVRQSMEQSTSNSDIRRLIGQGAVSFDESRVVSGDEVIEIPINGRLLKVGKRRWFKVMP